MTTSSTTSLLVALPAGYIADILGRKRSLVLGGVLTGFGIIGMVAASQEGIFYALNVLMGIAQSMLAAWKDARVLSAIAGSQPRPRR